MRGDIQSRIARLSATRTQRKAARALLGSLDIKQHIAPVYYPLHDDIQAGAHTVYNLPGGRGSCKSSFVSLEIVKGIMDDPTSNAIVFRRYAATLRDSVFSQIAWAIDIFGVNHLWRGGVSPMQYTYLPTGAQIIFRRLDDASKLKSIKPRKGTFRFVWFEEFSELPGPNFTRNVLQSVMRGQGNNFIVFRSFNPPMSRNNWANQLIQEPDERAETLLTDYTMIPPEWLGDSFIYEAERLKQVNPKAYEHEYLGHATGTGGEVFQNLEIREITQEEADAQEYIYEGVDFGFAADPLSFLRVAYDRKTETIYLLDEIYKRGMSNKATAEEIIEKGYHETKKLGYVSPFWNSGAFEKQTIVCDAAEPKSIQDLQNLGLRAVPCFKKPGCVRYRVQWLQHRKIVIDPARTPNAYREFSTYSYETDKDGVILSELPDRDNHCIDSLAYALNNLIYYTKGQSA